MKYAKTAAFVAGSVVALGTAAPAFAVTNATAPNFSLNGGLNQVVESAPQAVDPIVDTVSGAAKSVQKNGTVTKLAGQATGAAKGAAPLMGGLPLGG
ncbi:MULTISPECIES: hypothetical protein [unclassified Streptomyces]|uniref:hypothetical protein n=1 Tax=unclassified Streptomyces TaxID=2593676 RepID=UPI00081B7E3C|nr:MULTISPECIES: hypothetical protein [unclassified Streptomyces]MEE1749985.1 hypothetical protein [Streptomyces sp. JV184]MYQ85078.1 hypothetical protein [Streptomyces sp. SID4936]SCD97862.1 hypothetical protein GA0115234_1055224 [Streptomyces sp. DvalAA-43]